MYYKLANMDQTYYLKRSNFNTFISTIMNIFFLNINIINILETGIGFQGILDLPPSRSSRRSDC